METILKKTDIDAFAQLLSKPRNILVSGHISPDGDSLGSMIAMVEFLRKAGHEAVAAAELKALGKPGFLDGVDEILPLRKLKRRKFNLVIAVDCATLERLPAEVRPFAERLPLVCIDHHATNPNFGVLSIVDPDASSTGEIVWELAKSMGWEGSLRIAEALWVAIVTDSGRFAYDSTRPSTLTVAAELLPFGVRTAKINDILFSSFPRKSMQLKCRAWRSLHIWKNRKVCEVTLTRDDFREVRGTKADAEDVIDIPRSAAGNEIALFFYELLDRKKQVRVSIRTRAPWDATTLAAKFGGGGHIRAAGCTIKGTMSIVKRKMRAAVKELLAK